MDQDRGLERIEEEEVVDVCTDLRIDMCTYIGFILLFSVVAATHILQRGSRRAGRPKTQ